MRSFTTVLLMITGMACCSLQVCRAISSLIVISPDDFEPKMPEFGPSSFGPPLLGATAVRSRIELSPVPNGCQNHVGEDGARLDFRGRILLVSRGVCSFARKVYLAQIAGAAGVLIANGEVPSESLMPRTPPVSGLSSGYDDAWNALDVASNPVPELFQMADDGMLGMRVRIPSLLIHAHDALNLVRVANVSDVSIGLVLPLVLI
eukprot:ANDGO_04070.mRNA.1 hypothetical protein